MLVLRADKPVERRGKILFVNAKDEFFREGKQAFLNQGHKATILDAYRGFEDVERFAAVATKEHVAANRYSLAIPLYVTVGRPDDAGTSLSVSDALTAWRQAADASDSGAGDALRLLRNGVSA